MTASTIAVAPARDARAGMAGALLAAGGAISYGVTIVAGRSLARAGLGPATALGIRFGVAALALAAVLLVRRVPLAPSPGLWVRIVALGAIAYAGQSTLFFLSLERGTAASCVLLFYAWPAMVTLFEVRACSTRLQPATAGALALSAAGTAVVVTAGAQVAISPAGIVFALGSAAVFALYVLVGACLGARCDPMVTAAWVAAGASASSLGRGALTGTFVSPAGHWHVLLVYGLGTAAAFSLMFAAMARIGPTRTSVVMTLEALSAAVLAGLFLAEPLTPLQGIGGAAVLAAAVMVALAREGNRA